jgi:ABC-type multidrug transport system permease subunit
MAFRNRLPDPVSVVVMDVPEASAVTAALDDSVSRTGTTTRPGVSYLLLPREEADRRLRTGRAVLVIEPRSDSELVYHLDPTRPEALAARFAVDDALQRHRGRKDPVVTTVDPVTEHGARYIDFLIPGLLAMNTMGGGLWGIGFLIVNFRIMKLLKRFVATPMPRHNFLLAVLGARLTFLLPDVSILLGMGVLLFQMPIRGNLLLVALLEVVGALAFAGLGLLVAARSQSTEAVSGLINLINLPMTLLCGVLFPYERFPEAIHGFIRALPLTQLVDALRKVLLEGAGLAEVSGSLAILAAWAVGTFLIALRAFRWT